MVSFIPLFDFSDRIPLKAMYLKIKDKPQTG